MTEASVRPASADDRARRAQLDGRAVMRIVDLTQPWRDRIPTWPQFASVEVTDITTHHATARARCWSRPTCTPAPTSMPQFITPKPVRRSTRSRWPIWWAPAGHRPAANHCEGGAAAAGSAGTVRNSI